MKTMFQTQKLPQHDFWSLHVKRVHSSWTWQMHRCTTHSIISCYAATTPLTQLYQLTSNKKYSLYFWLYYRKSTEYFPRTHTHTHTCKEESCANGIHNIDERTILHFLELKNQRKNTFSSHKMTNSDTEFDPFITSSQCCNYQTLKL
jgi:hypothetical protein